WARPTGAGNWERFIDLGNGAGVDNILFARVGTTRNLALGVPGVSAIAWGAIDSDTWQHFAATMDASGAVILYKNGVAIGTGQLPIPNVVTRTSNYVGRSNWGLDAYYVGKMDDLRVYTRA